MSSAGQTRTALSLSAKDVFHAFEEYYNALGHFSATWRDARFQSQLLAAIRWTGSR
jgi:hypothetical protein